MIASLLAPQGADTGPLRASLSSRSIDIAAVGAPSDALIVFGGLEVRTYIDGGEHQGNLIADVVEQVCSAHAHGKWIGAPCVALAVVLQALEQDVAAGGASQHRREDGCIIFDDLRVMGTERSLLGLSSDQIAARLDRFTDLFSQHAHGTMQNATTEAEHNAHH